VATTRNPRRRWQATKETLIPRSGAILDWGGFVTAAMHPNASYGEPPRSVPSMISLQVKGAFTEHVGNVTAFLLDVDLSYCQVRRARDSLARIIYPHRWRLARRSFRPATARWPTIDPARLDDVAHDLWRDERLQSMRPEDAAEEWLKPVSTGSR
jgi:hypothetical protein